MIRYADFLLGLKPLYLPTVLAIKRAFPWKVQADSDTALRKLMGEGARNYAHEIAEVYASRSERDEALKWLDRAYAPEGRRAEMDQTRFNLCETRIGPRLQSVSAEDEIPRIALALVA